VDDDVVRFRAVGLDCNAAAINVEDVVEGVPGAEGSDPAPEIAPPVQPLEHRHVRVGAEVVPVDARIGCPGKHLIVSRIGEPEGVGDVDEALEVAVAHRAALSRQRSPHERHECLASLDWSRPPVFPARCLGVAAEDLGRTEQDGGVRAAEDLLPAEPVGYDEDDVGCIVPRCDRAQGVALVERGHCQDGGGKKGAVRAHEGAYER
jgi:hypothetical protein